LGELLEVIFCIAFSWNSYISMGMWKYIGVCVCTCTFLIQQVLGKCSMCCAMSDVMADKGLC
jgi:hypothetical protein